ncbi:MAG: hypothetical protein KF796_19665 [Ramlibacter sp.]|nr:hypothetical protein [Ramlibacter sp.]
MSAFVIAPVNAANMNNGAPYGVTDSMIVSSTVPEDDYPEWDPDAAYAAKERCIRSAAGIHRVFERLIAGTTATLPEEDALNWADVSATNAWKLFDMYEDTVTVADSPLTIVLSCGRITSLALTRVQADELTITETSGASVVFNPDPQSLDASILRHWRDYFFAPKRQVDVVTRLDVPPYSDGVITITLTKATGQIQLGKLVVGTATELGELQYRSRVRRLQLSRIERGPFGNLKTTRLRSIPQVSASLVTKTEIVAQVDAVLDDLRATPAVWILIANANNPFAKMHTIVGLSMDSEVSPDNAKEAITNLQIEGI